MTSSVSLDQAMHGRRHDRLESDPSPIAAGRERSGFGDKVIVVENLRIESPP